MVKNVRWGFFRVFFLDCHMLFIFCNLCTGHFWRPTQLPRGGGVPTQISGPSPATLPEVLEETSVGAIFHPKCVFWWFFSRWTKILLSSEKRTVCVNISDIDRLTLRCAFFNAFPDLSCSRDDLLDTVPQVGSLCFHPSFSICIFFCGCWAPPLA